MMDLEPIQHEREYLEGLLNTRFNFFLLIMSGLGAALLAEGDLGSRTSTLLLALGTVAALAMGLIILRTAALLRAILDMLDGTRYSDGALCPKDGRPAAPTSIGEGKSDSAEAKAVGVEGAHDAAGAESVPRRLPDNPYRMASLRVGQAPWPVRRFPNANTIIGAAVVAIPLLLLAAATASGAGAFGKPDPNCPPTPAPQSRQ